MYITMYIAVGGLLVVPICIFVEIEDGVFYTGIIGSYCGKVRSKRGLYGDPNGDSWIGG